MPSDLSDTPSQSTPLAEPAPTSKSWLRTDDAVAMLLGFCLILAAGTVAILGRSADHSQIALDLAKVKAELKALPSDSVDLASNRKGLLDSQAKLEAQLAYQTVVLTRCDSKVHAVSLKQTQKNFAYTTRPIVSRELEARREERPANCCLTL